MPTLVTTPTAPTHHQRVPGLKRLKAPTGDCPDPRPRTISATRIGAQINTMQNRYTTTNAAPPPRPTWVGNPQMLPSPTAEPAAARMKPRREPQCPRSGDVVMRVVSCDQSWSPLA